MPGAVAPARAWPMNGRNTGMGIIAELVRRGLVVLLVVLVALGVIVGDAAKPARRSPACPKGYELRTVRPLGRRLVAIRVQVILA